MSGRKKKNRKKKRRTTGGPNLQHAHGMGGPGGMGVGGGPNVLPGIPGVLPDFPIPPGLELPPGFPNPDSFLSFLFFEHLRKLQERGGPPSSEDDEDDLDDEIDYDDEDDEEYTDDDEIGGMGHHHVGCDCHLGHLDHKSLADVIRDMLRECCEFQTGLGLLINILEYAMNRFSLFTLQDCVGIMSVYKVTDFQLELDDSEHFSKYFEASDIKVTFEVLANCVLDYLHDSQWLDFKHITPRYGFPAAPPHPYVVRTSSYPKKKKGSKPKPGDPNYDPEQGDREDEFHTGGAAATMNMMTELSKDFYQEIGIATKYILTHVLKYSRNECLNGFILAIVEDIAFPEDTELNQAVLDVCFTDRIDESQAGDYFTYASRIGLTVDADDIKVQQTALNRMCCEHRNQQAGNGADLVRDVMELEISRRERYAREIEMREKLNKVKAKALPYTSCLCLPTRLSNLIRVDDVAKMKSKGSNLIGSIYHSLFKKKNDSNEADEVKLQKIEEILQTDGSYVNFYWLYKLYRFATSSKEAFHFAFPTFRAIAPSVICSRAMVDYGIIEYLLQSTSELAQSTAKFDLLHIALQTINKAVWALRCAPLALRLRKLVRAKIVQTLSNLREYNKSTPDCNLSIRRLAFSTIELISADRNNELATDLMNTGLVLTYKSLLPKIFDMSMDQDESICVLNTLKWLLNANNTDSDSHIAYFMTAFGEEGCVNFIQLKNLSDSKQLLSSELASPIHHIHKSICKTPQYQAALKKVPESSAPSASKKQRLCATCQKPAKNKCSVCLKVVYCNRNCQKADWKTHKPICKKDDNDDEEEDLPITAAMGSLGTVD